MKRMSRSFVVLAALLAVLMPLEQAHCAWMGLEKRATVVAQPPGHACCAPTAPSQPQDTRSPAGCVCVQLPLGSLTAGISSAQVLQPISPAVMLTPAPLIAWTMTIEAPAPALDVGSPPLPVDLGALGPRAPPLSA
jgi:hypothetical protein